jgi:hypothetical protein
VVLLYMDAPRLELQRGLVIVTAVGLPDTVSELRLVFITSYYKGRKERVDLINIDRPHHLLSLSTTNT